VTPQQRGDLVRNAHRRREAALLQQALCEPWRPAPSLQASPRDQYEAYHVAAAEHEAELRRRAGEVPHV